MKKKGFFLIAAVSMTYFGYYYFWKDGSQSRKKVALAIEELKEHQELVHNLNLNILETSIKIFRQNKGRNPSGLEELVEEGFLSEIPASGSREWKYNPDTGDVK